MVCHPQGALDAAGGGVERGADEVVYAVLPVFLAGFAVGGAGGESAT